MNYLADGQLYVEKTAMLRAKGTYGTIYLRSRVCERDIKHCTAPFGVMDICSKRQSIVESPRCDKVNSTSFRTDNLSLISDAQFCRDCAVKCLHTDAADTSFGVAT